MARLVRGGKVLDEVPLPFAGERSTFAAKVPLNAAGPVELQVIAMDAANANFGWMRQNLSVTP